MGAETDVSPSLSLGKTATESVSGFSTELYSTPVLCVVRCWGSLRGGNRPIKCEGADATDLNGESEGMDSKHFPSSTQELSCGSTQVLPFFASFKSTDVSGTILAAAVVSMVPIPVVVMVSRPESS